MHDLFETTYGQSVDRYQQEIARFPALSLEQEAAYILNLPSPDAATALIEGYLSFVVQIAHHYLGKGIGLMDLIGEGNLCLVQVVRTFSSEQSTPLCRCLDDALHRVMQQATSSDPGVSLLSLEYLEDQSSPCLLSVPRKLEEILLIGEADRLLHTNLIIRQRKIRTHSSGEAG